MKLKTRDITSMVACIMVCAAYLCSATGFDVHTDGHDGRTYVVSLLKGTSCEAIHPDDDCACCHHHHEAIDCHEANDPHGASDRHEANDRRETNDPHEASDHHEANDPLNDAGTPCIAGALCHEGDDCTDDVEVLEVTGTDEGFQFELAPAVQLTTEIQVPAHVSFSAGKSYAGITVSPPPRLRLLEYSVLRV